MIGAVSAKPIEIFEAVVALSQSLAGRTDLNSLVAGVAESLFAELFTSITSGSGCITPRARL